MKTQRKLKNGIIDFVVDTKTWLYRKADGSWLSKKFKSEFFAPLFCSMGGVMKSNCGFYCILGQFSKNVLNIEPHKNQYFLSENLKIEKTFIGSSLCAKEKKISAINDAKMDLRKKKRLLKQIFSKFDIRLTFK